MTNKTNVIVCCFVTAMFMVSFSGLTTANAAGDKPAEAIEPVTATVFDCGASGTAPCDKEEENPTYTISKEGVWDWMTFSGNRRYHAECHVCHGPFGLGSTYAPNLADSLKTMTFEKFQEVVINGQKNIWGRNNSIMPALGTNKNVYCFLDDLYLYLKARADEKLKPYILAKHMKKEKRSQESRDYQNECFDG